MECPLCKTRQLRSLTTAERMAVVDLDTDMGNIPEQICDECGLVLARADVDNELATGKAVSKRLKDMCEHVLATPKIRRILKTIPPARLAEIIAELAKDNANNPAMMTTEIYR